MNTPRPQPTLLFMTLAATLASPLAAAEKDGQAKVDLPSSRTPLSSGPSSSGPSSSGPSSHEPSETRFAWLPPGAPAPAYRLSDPSDQHRIVFFEKSVPGKSYPVVIAMHGQPSRSKSPRDYWFFGPVKDTIGAMVASEEIPPVILVMPAFRFKGQNWPDFDLGAFRTEVRKQLAALGVEMGEVVVFGHSGAAGCGGDGMNRAHRLKPAAVGFFDTCLGRGWAEEIGRLHSRKIPTLNLHSVETAGFRPRQRPEYQANFDFGRAYAPLGIRPVDCPTTLPEPALRTQKYRCSATPDGVIRAFVVDTGEGAEAHQALLPTAIRYFLKTFAPFGR